ncbi:hypothetical protein KKC91_11935 [bacterium]|nr:hypothetical protein [bacterium]MBU1852672.1 hypothetical protein [Candidatus Omnitrophota bacterium]
MKKNNSQTKGKEWLLVETPYQPKKSRVWESIFALGNGYMGTRASLEEGFSGSKICPGTFVAGVFDTYEQNYQEIVNLPDYFSTRVTINKSPLNLSTGKVRKYHRALDMYKGIVTRSFEWKDPKGNITYFEISRIVSLKDPHIAALKYKIRPLNYNGKIKIENDLDANIGNIDFRVSGYQIGEAKHYHLEEYKKGPVGANGVFLTTITKTTKHRVCEAIQTKLYSKNIDILPSYRLNQKDKFISRTIEFDATSNNEYIFEKIVAVYGSRDNVKDLKKSAISKSKEGLKKGFDRLFKEHAAIWAERWKTGDLTIEGDSADQQSIRFSMYHLMQMCNEKDPYVNISSRGLTSEMHMGNYFWDTEMFILPYFIYTNPEAARTLLKYRYLTLPQARKKAKKIGFKGAMYPWMSSYPGDEQCFLWEYANLGVHVVAAITYGIWHYYQATGDEKFIRDYATEIIIETARFWESRVHFSPIKKKYVINTVKGPDEYGWIVNNNVYTNWMARWNLTIAGEIIKLMKKKHPKAWKKVKRKINFEGRESIKWRKIANNIYINYDPQKKLYIEHDLFLEREKVDPKVLKPGKQIATEAGATLDTILRCQIVKQADILHLMYIYNDAFTRKQKQIAWDFYEPKTLHDSSLSWSIHAIMAAELGFKAKAYEYFLKSSRLDLYDEMENTFLGIHSASSGGTWQAIVNGFCGMRLLKEGLSFNPSLPNKWNRVSFKLIFRGDLLSISIDHKTLRILLEEAKRSIKIRVQNRLFEVAPDKTKEIAL